jgi:hypothetical protein
MKNNTSIFLSILSFGLSLCLSACVAQTTSADEGADKGESLGEVKEALVTCYTDCSGNGGAPFSKTCTTCSANDSSITCDGVVNSCTRSYTCGYAMSGYNCNNGRNHAFVTAVDMTAAIAACHAAQLSGYPDFCYVIDSSGGTSSDITQCTAASGSWRSGNNCCNFKGTLSCPATCTPRTSCHAGECGNVSNNCGGTIYCGVCGGGGGGGCFKNDGANLYPVPCD